MVRPRGASALRMAVAAKHVEHGAPPAPAAPPESAASYEQRIEALVTRQLRATLRKVRAVGDEEVLLGSPAELAARMMASLPFVDPMNIEAGPFYTGPALVEWLGVSRQWIYELTKQGRVLAVVTGDGHKLYPAFQFRATGQPLPEMPGVLAALGPGVDGWAVAAWFTTPRAELGGRTPIEWLDDDGEPAAVLRLAGGDGLALAS